MRWMAIFLFLLSVQSFAQTVDSSATEKVIIINGGGSADDNFSSFEDEVLNFSKSFPKNISRTIINAGGKGDDLSVKLTSNENETIVRDAEGNVVYNKDSVGGLPANRQTVTTAILSSQNQTTGNLVIYYADHGEPHTLDLWNDEEMEYSKIRDLYQQLPQSLMVQEIHTHCYAGASLVDTKRVQPQSLVEVEKFLDANYPQNRCGFAVANYDELSFGYIGGVIDEKNAAGNPANKSLQAIADAVTHHLDDNSSLPSLKSDYFLDDMNTYLCRIQKPPENSTDKACQCDVDKPSELKNISKMIESQEAISIKKLCTIRSRYNVDKLSSKIRILSHEAIEGCEGAALKKADPKMWEKMTVAINRRDAAKASELLNKKYVKDVTDTVVKNWQKQINQLDDQLKEKCVAQADGRLQDAEEFRTNKILAERKERRALIESILKMDPGLKVWNDRYQNLRTCETANFR